MSAPYYGVVLIGKLNRGNMYKKTFRERLDHYSIIEGNYYNLLSGDGDMSPEKRLERLRLLSELQKDALMNILQDGIAKLRALEVQASEWERKCKKLKERKDDS
jgi:hypothetical protein